MATSAVRVAARYGYVPFMLIGRWAWATALDSSARRVHSVPGTSAYDTLDHYRS